MSEYNCYCCGDDKADGIWTCQDCEEIENDETEKLQAENEELREKHTMQLAAISTILFCNTRETLDKNIIFNDNPCWSVAFGDAVSAIQREILLIEENSKLKTTIKKMRDALVKYDENVDYYEAELAGSWGDIRLESSKTLKEIKPILDEIEEK